VGSNPFHGKVYSVNIKFVSDLQQVGGFLRFPPTKWQPRYSWNIVESGVKCQTQTKIKLIKVFY
jgi:hypothetical protein